MLGVDVSAQLLERARQRTAAAGLHNVTYELGDAQVHRFGQRQFDVIISRFGTMFFDDPVAAFANIARAAPPGSSPRPAPRPPRRRRLGWRRNAAAARWALEVSLGRSTRVHTDIGKLVAMHGRIQT